MRLIFVALASLLLMAVAPDDVTAPPASPDPTAPTPITVSMVSDGKAQIQTFSQGEGPLIVVLPSLGRGAADYDAVAAMIAMSGFRVVRPQPRGIGGSTGPLTGLTLHDYANDVAAVIAAAHDGPAVVVGHAFGNFVARMLATDHPAAVRALVLAAASAGKPPPGVHESPISPEIRRAIDDSGDLKLSQDQRLKALQTAFFAPGHDPSVWLGGWYPAAMRAESEASVATPVDAWFAGGHAPILDLQAADDTVAPRRFSAVLRNALGPRVITVVIADAGHALIPEQPAAVAAAVAVYAKEARK